MIHSTAEFFHNCAFFQTSTYVCFVWRVTLDITFKANLKHSKDDCSSEIQSLSLWKDDRTEVSALRQNDEIMSGFAKRG